MTVMRLAKATLLGASLAALAAGAPMAASVRHHAAAHAAAPTVEPEAVAALARMSAYLRTNPTFEVKLAIQRDDVDAYGQILTFNGLTTYKVRAPDGLNIEVSDDQGTKQYIYDGKSVTVFDPKTGFYAHFAAPPTIRATLEEAETKYGIVVPLADLFRWGQDGDQASQLTSAHYVETTQVDGQEADHYAFRQDGVDWQIWIATGDKPLPLRVVIVPSDDPARPQFEADLTWDVSPQFAADTFVFTPPPQARAIPIATASQ
jgi:hypothetical protein